MTSNHATNQQAPRAFMVRRVAVLGAGVMGAQIAAHLVNANVEVLLFELPAAEGEPNGNVQKAIENLKKLEPSPLSVARKAGLIQAANYGQHLDLMTGCDLVIEAISERMDWKADLYRKVAGVGVSGKSAFTFLRRAFFQPAALYASGGIDRLP